MSYYGMETRMMLRLQKNMREHHQYLFHQRPEGPSWPGQLLRCQGRRDRLHQSFGAGRCSQRRDRQLRRTGLYCDGNGFRHAPRCVGQSKGRHSLRPLGRKRRNCARCFVLGRRSRLHQWLNAHHQWRSIYRGLKRDIDHKKRLSASP